MARQETVDGRYQLVRKIGMGGMGVVYEARDVSLSRRVAIKFLVESPSPDSALLERFRREARALARISDPGAVTLHDTGLYQDVPYLVMEYLDGVDLQTLVDREGPLPEVAVLGISAGACSGLAAAHTAGVLHRDVKPSNVRITTEGRVVLQDFGLARLVGETAITRIGALVGTTRYMAPEVMRGEGPSPASDLYGLGLCMYLMLTGRTPLAQADEVGAVVELAQDAGTDRLSGTHTSSRPALTALIDALSALEPATRHQDAGSVLRLLEPMPQEVERHLEELVHRCVRTEAAEAVRTSPAADTSYPEYFEAEGAEDAPDPFRSSPTTDAVSLSDVTREAMLNSMTSENALSRQREAVNLVLRGEFQEAARVLAAVVQVSTATHGPDHPTTLAAQYWQAVCLTKLGAGGEALALFSGVNTRIGDTTQGTEHVA